jgi:hypothetical protein
MFVNLTRVRTGDRSIEDARIVAEEMERWLQQIEGYEGFLMLIREGTAIGMTFWESRDVAERHRTTRIEFRDRMLAVAGVEIEETIEFEVAYARFGPRLTGAE